MKNIDKQLLTKITRSSSP